VNSFTGNIKALLIADACDCIHEMKDGRIIASHPHGQ
jgi:hypothetical protein